MESGREEIMTLDKLFWHLESNEFRKIQELDYSKFKPEGSNLYEDLQRLCDDQQCKVHPSFRQVKRVLSEIEREQMSEEQLANYQAQEEENKKMFKAMNQKFDHYSWDMLLRLTPNYNLQTMKFSGCDLDPNILLRFVEKNTTVRNLYIDWNPQSVQSDAFARLVSPESILELLSLRACNLQDQDLTQFWENIATNKCLRVLDLYNNDLSQQFTGCVAALEKNRSLDALLLRKCCLTEVQLEQLNTVIGKQPIDQEQVDEIRKLEKEREAIIQKNLKAKKQEPVPVVDPLEMEEENAFVFRNSQFKLLNIAGNVLDSRSFLFTLLGNTRELKVMMTGDYLTSKEKRKFDKLYPGRLIL